MNLFIRRPRSIASPSSVRCCSFKAPSTWRLTANECSQIGKLVQCPQLCGEEDYSQHFSSPLSPFSCY
ncbi:hypothetical protein E2C01_059545 [Portunus trituberculatus]|uniref:Uncharacterized protein n=1 Tax=Portunus trituberculatus TaxID=210409 RepID=A0A5B7GYH4_PORTR|nr:hypothetical protein [Portunus trituberculatus]